MNRIEKIQESLVREGFDAALLLYSRDILYYAGTAQPCNLLIPATKEPILFARRAAEMVREDTSIQIVEESDIEAVKDALLELGFKSGVLGVELDVIPAKIAGKIGEVFRDFKLKDISPLILEQRMIKDAKEVSMIREAASKFDVAHRVIMDYLKPGVSELSLGAEVGAALRRSGVEGRIFPRRWDSILPLDGIMASGENLYRISGQAMTVTGTGLGRSLPWGPSMRKLKKGDLLVVDLAINLQGYHGDVARTYVVGRADERQRQAFETLLKLHRHSLSTVREGISAEESYLSAKNMVRKLGYLDYFMGYGKQKSEYLGHGLGLESDEPPLIAPRVTRKLRRGMVITIEPKFIIPRWGAVMIEDDLLVKKDGYERLSSVEMKLFEAY